MRRLTLLLTALAALALALTPAQAGAAKAKRTPCATAKGRTLAASPGARVYLTGTPDDGHVYGCWLASRRRTDLGQVYEVGESSSAIGTVTIAGRFAAFESDGGSGDEPEASVVLVDLSTGRTTHADAVVPDDGTAVSQVAPTESGTVVWIGQASDCAGVHAFARGSVARTLSCGAASDLAVTNKRVYWLQDGQPRTALLG